MVIRSWFEAHAGVNKHINTRYGVNREFRRYLQERGHQLEGIDERL